MISPKFKELYHALDDIFYRMLLEDIDETDITTMMSKPYKTLYIQIYNGDNGIMLEYGGVKDSPDSFKITYLGVPERHQGKGIATNVILILEDFIERHKLSKKIYMHDMSPFYKGNITIWQHIFSKFPKLQLVNL